MRTPATAVVAVKAWSRAKSRLVGAAGPDRSQLVRAMTLDTCGAVVAGGCRLVVVSDQPGLGDLLAEHEMPATVLPDPGGGLNPALTAGAATVADGADPAVVLAVVSDLPCLDADALSQVLAETSTGRGPAAGPGRWFVPDLAGVGTTMLLARGEPLAPAFEGASAERHRRSGARALTAPEGARLDVDDEAALVRALARGVGPHTAAWARHQPWLRPAPHPAGAVVHRFLPASAAGPAPRIG